MSEPARGYIEAPHHNPPKAAWKEYSEWCRQQQCPRILVAKATYWKVAVDVLTVQNARFADPSRTGFSPC